jgi:hypothetical protein
MTGPARRLLTVACDNGDHEACCGREWIPLHAHLVAPCGCSGCGHANAWTRAQAEDRILAGMHRAYPGETVWVDGDLRVLGAWPGSKPRPVVYRVFVDRGVDETHPR